MSKLEWAVNDCLKNLKKAEEHVDALKYELRGWRKEIRQRGDCEHDKTVPWKWRQDDGYGHWWEGVGKSCVYCEFQCQYPPKDDKPGHWYLPIWLEGENEDT